MTVEIICPSVLRQLDDRDLVSGLMRLSDGERVGGASIIAHLIVMDERQTYVPMGYATLWKYSHGWPLWQAHFERIEAGVREALGLSYSHSRAG